MNFPKINAYERYTLEQTLIHLNEAALCTDLGM